MGDVHYGREACGAHRWDVREVHDEVGVSEAIPAFGEDDLVIAALGDFVCCVLHPRSGEELSLLDVHDLAGTSRGCDEVGLTAEEGWYLQDVHIFGGHLCFLGLVNIRHYGDVEGLAYTA